MRILHLVHTPGPGGTETVVENLIRWQSGTDMIHAVACPKGHLADTARSLGANVYNIPFEVLRRSPNPVKIFNSPRVFSLLKNAISDAVADFDPVIVHSHSVKATVVGRHALRMYPRVKLIWHLHDYAPLGRFRRLFIALAQRAADAVAAVSRDVAETVCPDSKVRIVYNAVDIHDEVQIKRNDFLKDFDLPTDHIVFGYLGRLHREKGIHVLLEAFGILRSRNNQSHLLIAGEPPSGDASMRNELETLTDRLNIGENISFTGRISDLPGFYSSIDVFVLPAPREPFGLVILEALSHGRPVIACDAGGPREILSEFKGAILVEPHDPSAMACAMETMMNNSNFGEFARSHGPSLVRESFSPRAHLRSIHSLYEELHQ